MNRFPTTIAAVCICFGGYGCAGTYAGEGAKAGLVGGAVAGAVGSLFWGGNVVGNMAAGAVTSAAAGAAVGAMTKKPAAQQPPPEAAAPRASGQSNATPSHAELVKREQAVAERIGPENFEAARLLARCDHKGAIQQAQKAFAAAQTQERRAYALMIEAVSAEEAGDTNTAAAVYPQLLTLDPSRESVVKARNDALSGILQVQRVRKDYGLPATCA